MFKHAYGKCRVLWETGIMQILLFQTAESQGSKFENIFTITAEKYTDFNVVLINDDDEKEDNGFHFRWLPLV